MTLNRTSRPSPAGRPCPRWAVLLFGLLFGAQWLVAQTTTVWELDLNGDQLTDVSEIHETVMQPVGGGFGRFQYAYFVAGGGGALLAPATDLTTNDFVTLEAGPGATWQDRLLLWWIFLETGEGWPSFMQRPYVGVRFAAPDGVHLGWFNRENLTDFGWQPQPGQPIRVGGKPSSSPPDDQESMRLVAVDLDGAGPDLVLRVRHWTNVLSGMTGVSAVLTNRLGFKILVAPGQVEGALAWFPWPVPEGVLIPINPPSPARWQGPPAAVVLLEEKRDGKGHLLSSAGPLASDGEVKIAVRSVDSSGGRKGWVRFSREFQLLGQDFSGSPGGEPPPQAHEASRYSYDLNGDGWLDYAQVFCSDGHYDALMGEFYGRTWTLLFPLRYARILSRGLPANALISMAPPAPDAWETAGVTLRSTVNIPMTEVGSSVFPGLVGLQFAGDNGQLLGWLRPEDDAFAFEPRPGEPLAAGVVPKSIGAAHNDGELVLLWNRSLNGYALEGSPAVVSPAWQVETVPNAGRVALPPEDPARFFRLALPGQPPGLLRVFQEFPGPIHAIAFRGDADHLVVVHAGGPALLRADGHRDRAGDLLPAGFRMETASVSADADFALCAGALRAATGTPGGVDDARAYWVRLTDMRLQTVTCHPGLAGTCQYAFRGGDVSSGGEQILLTNGGNEVVSAQATEGEFQPRWRLSGMGPVAFSPDGKQAVTCYYNPPSGVGLPEGGVRLWNLADGALVRTWYVGPYVSALAFCADGTQLATGTVAENQGVVRLWTLKPVNQESRRFEAGRTAMRCVALSPDGRHLLAADHWSKTAWLWRVDTGVLLRMFEGHPGEVTAVAISPDNRRVATGTTDGLVLLWDVSDVVGP